METFFHHTKEFAQIYLYFVMDIRYFYMYLYSFIVWSLFKNLANIAHIKSKHFVKKHILTYMYIDKGPTE